MRHNFTSLHDLSVSDESLCEQSRRGDKSAYQKLYNKYLSILYNYGHNIHPDKSVVDDSIQELYLDMWKYKNNLCGIKNIKHYLLRSLKNRIIKEMRQNRHIVASNLESEHCDPIEKKIIEDQTQSDKKIKLRKALNALTKRQREMINLLFYQKFSYGEAADAMNINLRSAYTLSWKSLSALRKALRS